MSEQGKHPHDYRTTTDTGVELVVRAGNKYGQALAGEAILVDRSELRNAATMAACALREDLERAAAAKAEKIAALKAERAKNTVMSAVEAGLAEITASVDKAKIKAGQEAADASELARDKAIAEAAAGLVPDVFARTDEMELPDLSKPRPKRKK